MCFFAAGPITAGVQTGMTAAAAAAANMALMTAVSTAATMTQAQANASALSKHQQKQHDLQKEVSQADAFSKYAAIADQSREREIGLSHALLSNKRKAEEAKSMSRVMAGEGGVQGKSVGLILGDVEKQNQQYQTALLQQQKFEDAQYIRQGEGIRSGQYSAILSSAPNPVPEPDYLGALAGIGSSALGTYYSAS